MPRGLAMERHTAEADGWSVWQTGPPWGETTRSTSDVKWPCEVSTLCGECPLNSWGHRLQCLVCLGWVWLRQKSSDSGTRVTSLLSGHRAVWTELPPPCWRSKQLSCCLCKEELPCPSESVQRTEEDEKPLLAPTCWCEVVFQSMTSNPTHWGSPHDLPSPGEGRPCKAPLWVQMRLLKLRWTGTPETSNDWLLTQTTGPGKFVVPIFLWLETTEGETVSARDACEDAPEAGRGLEIPSDLRQPPTAWPTLSWLHISEGDCLAVTEALLTWAGPRTPECPTTSPGIQTTGSGTRLLFSWLITKPRDAISEQTTDVCALQARLSWAKISQSSR